MIEPAPTPSPFAATADCLRPVSGKLEKIRLLAGSFRDLPDEDLSRAAGYLRGGRKGGLGEDASAAAFEAKPAEGRKAHQLSGDLGKTAVGARHGRLQSLQVALFTPLKPMLATAEASPEAIAQRVGPEL